MNVAYYLATVACYVVAVALAGFALFMFGQPGAIYMAFGFVALSAMFSAIGTAVSLLGQILQELKRPKP